MLQRENEFTQILRVLVITIAKPDFQTNSYFIVNLKKGLLSFAGFILLLPKVKHYAKINDRLRSG